MYFVAILRPTTVFPAPGTPVTKQMAFLDSRRASSIIRDRVFEVRLRLIAPASLRDISATECPP
jgi:hypothetical protein